MGGSSAKGEAVEARDTAALLENEALEARY